MVQNQPLDLLSFPDGGSNELWVASAGAEYA
jgi:hypothetical protein